MANTFESNFTRKVAMKVLPAFEANRVLSKNVNTQLVAGAFNPDSGTQVDVKRPTDHTVIDTADGDISTTRSDIITGKATATVQNYITVAVDYDEVDEALKMGSDADRYWSDMTNRIVIDLEMKFGAFAMKGLGLNYGDPDEGVDSWAEVANAGALMQSSGVPMNKRWCYFLNPYSQVALATEQRSLGVNPEAGSANSRATVNTNFAGFDVKTATTLPTYTLPATGDLVGAINGTPDVTYATAKDTMTQSIVVDAFGSFTGTIPAGSVVQITGRNRMNLSTRSPIVDATGASVIYTATVSADASLTSGAGTLVITGPAIYEASGAYNTADSALADNDVVTILGTDSTTFQPNLFWHPDALTLASVPIKKLHSTDTLFTTADGLQLRCSKYSDGDANKQTVRFDLHPAFGVMNPFFGGHGYGVA
ncbi:MAG: hypothetical protein GY942_20930 [Aestuariibacter sp.]|nr:hypothetical protein [Aestuariibacter sp.]